MEIMKTVQFEFNAKDVKKARSKARKEFRKETQDTNIIYFFFSGKDCVYIGETGCSLSDRCFTHKERHIDKPWFEKCDQVLIVKLADNVDVFGRRAIESSFILAYKNAGYNIENKV